MSEKKQMNALDLFQLESQDDTSLVTKITTVDSTGIEYRESNEDQEDDDIEEQDESEIETSEDQELDQDSEELEDTEDESEEQDEESSSQEESEELGVYSTMANHLIEEDVLIPLEDKLYDESDEGFSELIKDTIDFKYKKHIDSLDSRVIREGITLKDLVEFMDQGGDPKEFLDTTIGQVDYKQVVVETDEDDLDYSISTQKQVIKDRLLLDEISEEEIQEMLTQYEESGILEKQAKMAIKTLIKKQDEEYSSMLDRQKQEKIARIEYLKKQEDELEKTVLGLTKIANFDTSEKERKDFLKFLTVPIKKDVNGNLLTQYQIESSDQKKVLELAFLQFKGGISGIEAKVEKKKNLKLQEKLSRFAEESKNNNRSTDSFEDTPTKSKNNGRLKIKFPEWM